MAVPFASAALCGAGVFSLARRGDLAIWAKNRRALLEEPRYHLVGLDGPEGILAYL